MDRIDFEETMLKNLKPPRPEPEQTTEVPKDPVVTVRHVSICGRQEYANSSQHRYHCFILKVS
jgi:hypothetical protein